MRLENADIPNDTMACKHVFAFQVQGLEGEKVCFYSGQSSLKIVADFILSAVTHIQN